MVFKFCPVPAVSAARTRQENIMVVLLNSMEQGTNFVKQFHSVDQVFAKGENLRERDSLILNTRLQRKNL